MSSTEEYVSGFNNGGFLSKVFFSLTRTIQRTWGEIKFSEKYTAGADKERVFLIIAKVQQGPCRRKGRSKKQEGEETRDSDEKSEKKIAADRPRLFRLPFFESRRSE